MMSFLARRPVWVLGAAAVLALAAVPIALRLEMSTELVQLLPAKLPSVRAFQGFDRKIGGHTFLTVIVESPDRGANERFADALAGRMARRSWAYQVHARREVEFIERRWPFLLSERELEKLEADLRSAMSRAKVKHSPLALDLDARPAEVKWDELRSFIHNGGHGQGSFRPYRTNADGTVLLVQVQLQALSSRVKEMSTILGDAQKDIDAAEPAAFHPQLQAHLYGGLRYRVEEYNSILSDLGTASLITFPLMLLVPALVLRSAWEPLVVLVPVAAGMAWTYAGAQLLFGSLNLVTCFLFLIVFGLGDDYPIHLLFRIREEIALGGGVRAAIERGLRHSAAPLACAAVTDTAALLSLAWMQFRGFSQFGMIAGGGVCLILLATFATVPGIVWLIRRRLEKKKAGGAEAAPRPAARPAPNWRWLAAVTGVWLAVTVAGAWLLTHRLRFEDDFDRLHPDLANLAQLRAKVETTDGYQRSAPAVFFTQDFEASRAATRALEARLDADGDSSTIGRIFSLAAIVDGDSAAKRACLGRIFSLLDEPAFRRAPADIQEQAARLRGKLDLAPITMGEIPPSIRRSLTRETAGADGSKATFYLVVVEPRRRTSLATEAAAFADRVGGVDYRGQRLVPAGEALIFAEILRLVKEEAGVAMLVACLATATIVLAAFRSWSDLVALMLSVTVAITATLGTLALVGMRLNFFNVTVFPLLVGLGINYGIHILHRYHEEGVAATQAVRRLAASVGSAAATTAVGFAGLLFARHPGLWSMGFTASLGIGYTILSCLIFLPAFSDLLRAARRLR
jgi:predicted RND superfamily exporter protein